MVRRGDKGSVVGKENVSFEKKLGHHQNFKP